MQWQARAAGAGGTYQDYNSHSICCTRFVATAVHLAQLELLGLADDGLDLGRAHAGLGGLQAVLFPFLHHRRQLRVRQQLHRHLQR